MKTISLLQPSPRPAHRGTQLVEGPAGWSVVRGQRRGWRVALRQRNFEGIVGKRAGSIYHAGVRSRLDKGHAAWGGAAREVPAVEPL